MKDHSKPKPLLANLPVKKRKCMKCHEPFYTVFDHICPGCAIKNKKCGRIIKMPSVSRKAGKTGGE